MGWTVDLPTTMYIAPELPQGIDPRGFIRLGSYEFQNVLNEVNAYKEVSLDTETTGLVRYRDIPLYWSLAYGQKRYCLHASTLQCFQEPFRDVSKTWIFANAKYDAHILANVGIRLAGKFHDTQVMHGLLYEERSHKLKDMAEHLFGWKWGSFEDLFGKIGKKQSSEDRIRVAERENMPMLIEYASNDAYGTLAIYYQLKRELEAAKTWSLFQNMHPFIDTLWDLFRKVEGPFTKVLWKMERRGVLIDTAYFDKIRPEAEEELLRLQQEISRLIGRVFNPKSPKALVEYFFQEKGYKVIKWTAGGKSGIKSPSTDADVMEALAGQGDSVAQLICDYAERRTLLSTYITGLRDHCDPHGRIHTSFNQLPRTGRLSSSEPNLQNIPRLENDKWGLRKAFIAPPGKRIIAGDYSQLEMRLLAAASMEQDMLGIFERGEDIHIGNASLIFNIPYQDIIDAKDIEKKIKAKQLPETAMTAYIQDCIDKRTAAKTSGFGLVYGMGVNKLAAQLRIHPSEAKKIMTAVLSRYKSVDKYLEDCVDIGMSTGYAYTLLGRRRAVPELHSYRGDEKARGIRICRNLPIQGTAADLVKYAQINIDSMDLDRHYGYEMELQVHDELVGECPDETCEKVMRELQDAMEHPFIRDLAVHTAVEIHSGSNWNDAK